MELTQVSILGCLLVVSSNAAFLTSETSEDNTRDTNSGRVKGFVQEVLGKRVDTYFGIPYALPPIGDMRFKKPSPVQPWSGVRNAIKLPNSCMQVPDTTFGNFSGATMWNPNTNISEDCLYLNVWTPHAASGEDLVVIVWIYGGGYMSGTSALDFYMAHNLAAFADVVVVSIQYRLGAFGFLYLGTEDAPGNMALLDQALALRWIRDNIEFFGGDPDRVTIIGESAGSSSVSYLLLSPTSRNLFRRAIMESATAISPFAYKPPEVARHRANSLAEAVGCFKPNNISDMVDCLRQIPAKKLAGEQYSAKVTDPMDHFSYYPFTPTLDGDFIQQPPEEYLKKRNFKKTSILLGTNRDEGSFFLLYTLPELFPNQEQLSITKEKYREATKKLFAKFSDVVHQLIGFEYSKWPYSSTNNAKSLSNMLGDFEFSCPVLNFAEAYARAGQDVYVYYFTHRSTNNPWPNWGGVMHGYEIDYILGLPLDKWRDYTSQEQNLSMSVMKYFSNFAKTG